MLLPDRSRCGLQRLAGLSSGHLSAGSKTAAESLWARFLFNSVTSSRYKGRMFVIGIG